MKKTLIAFAFLLFSISSFSQFSFTEWLSYRNEIGTWDKYKKIWVWGEIKKSSIPIFFDNYEIKLINVDKSVYTIIESDGSEDKYNKQGIRIKTSSWIAYDKKYRKCRVTVTRINEEGYDPLVFTVMYEDVCIRFYCKDAGKIDSYMND